MANVFNPTPKKAKKSKIVSLKDQREASGENQSQFWSKRGVTQSGGSRYESGRTVPKPVRMINALINGKATIEQLKSGELAAAV